MGKTKIAWADYTWNPLRVRVKPDAAAIATAKGYTSLVQIAAKTAGQAGHHCEHVSSECAECYSETFQSRCLKQNGTGLPFDRRSRDLVDPFVDEKILLDPLRWKKPRRIFVESQSDLFGEWYTDAMIERVFAVMAICHQHTFQVLTKRPERMLAYLSSDENQASALMAEDVLFQKLTNHGTMGTRWPLPNVWIGVSCGDQKTADARIPILVQTPAAKRFVSYEPALGPVEFGSFIHPKCVNCGAFLAWNGFHGRDIGLDAALPCGCKYCFHCADNRGRHEDHDAAGPHGSSDIDWLIVGGESGNGARPFHLEWARAALRQCLQAEVACFIKQLGRKPLEFDFKGALRREKNVNIAAAKHPWLQGFTVIHPPDGPSYKVRYHKLADRSGADPEEWAPDLRVQQFPDAPLGDPIAKAGEVR